MPSVPPSTPIDYNKVTIEEKKLMLDVLGPEEASKYAPSVERVNNIFAEQQQRWLEFRERRRAALDEMTKMSQEWGLYDEVDTLLTFEQTKLIAIVYIRVTIVNVYPSSGTIFYPAKYARD